MDPEFEHEQGPQLIVQFFAEDIDFQLDEQENLIRWIGECAAHEGFTIDEITYIFCSDEYLLSVNQQYLQHDDYTDIITFPYSDRDSVISGDIYISVERVRDNARRFHTTFEDELRRVIIHGVLHLVGYIDSSPADKDFMHQKEDYYLERYLH